MQFVIFRNRTNLAAVLLMAISLFGFLGNVMIDYNWGTVPIVNSVAILYAMTLMRIIPFPLNYWGLGAVVYFVLFLLSFVLLNRNEDPTKNLLETFRLASIILVLFEFGVFYFVPGWMDKWVIQALHGTPLDSFTNWDVLAVALISTIASQLALSWMRPRTKEASSTSGPLVLENR